MASNATSTSRRHVGAFQSSRAQKRYWIVLGVLIVLALGFGLLHLAWDNPMPFGTRGFWLIAERRANALIAIVVVALCQAMATVSFHTVTNNRIITPSIMGFESLYVAINTAAIFFLGSSGFAETQSLVAFVLKMLVMVGLSLVLYSWLLTGENNSMHAMLLVGVVIGGGLGSLSTFMQRMLTPSEFDILTARLFGSVQNANPDFFPIAIPVCLVVSALLYLNSRKLNVISLGRDAATNLGINHKVQAIYTLVLVSMLMAVTTALVGPMTFLGFLVATLAYQFAETYDHRFIFPVAILTGFVILTGAYFLMNHVFYAQGVVSIIIEMVGGSVFLFVIMKKGRL